MKAVCQVKQDGSVWVNVFGVGCFEFEDSELVNAENAHIQSGIVKVCEVESFVIRHRITDVRMFVCIGMDFEQFQRNKEVHDAKIKEKMQNVNLSRLVWARMEQADGMHQSAGASFGFTNPTSGKMTYRHLEESNLCQVASSVTVSTMADWTFAEQWRIWDKHNPSNSFLVHFGMKMFEFEKLVQNFEDRRD